MFNFAPADFGHHGHATQRGITPDRTYPILLSLLLMATAFAIRGPLFENPLIHVDENFYLLVGDRMLHGALPYVDIWDRKPIGLFLLYAGIRLLGGTGVVEHNVVAALAAGATAILIAHIARRMAGPAAATVSGVAYLLMIGLAGGLGGQTPVFYNPLVAGAALIILRALDDPFDTRAPRVRGAIAMVLIGLAIQIKYTVVFEGFFFGILLLIVTWRITRNAGAVAANAAIWIFIASAPTLLALGYYAARGHAQAFIYANFLSILGRSSEPMAYLVPRLLNTGRALGLPLLCVGGAALSHTWRDHPQGRPTFIFAAGWLGAALFGYFLFGTFFNHYALPLMVPIAVCMAPLFSERRHAPGKIVAAIVLIAGVGGYARAVYKASIGGAAQMKAELAAIEPRLTGCLYVYDGDAALYLLTHSCLPTRYPFSSHLMYTREVGAIGVDPLAEIRRILSTHPSVIVDTVDREERDENPAANAIARRELRRSYHLVARIAHSGDDMLIYQRKADM